MFTIEALNEYGANVQAGLARCMNNESFYLRMVGMAVADEGFGTLGAALGEKDLQKAFEAAHALKGILANLELPPVLKPVEEITEFLRARTEMDYAPLYGEIMEQYEKLKAIAE